MAEKEVTQMERSEDVIPDSYPLGPDGPSQQEVDSLKKKHGKVRAAFTGSKVYVVRMMSRSEHMALQNEIFERTEANDTDLDVDYIIAKDFTIWPSNIDWDKEPGGAVPVLSQEVSKLSGFVKDKESIEL